MASTRGFIDPDDPFEKMTRGPIQEHEEAVALCWQCGHAAHKGMCGFGCSCDTGEES
jgi:hypothetical protein